MVICLDGFKKVRENIRTIIWNKDTSYVVTDKKRNVLGMVNTNQVSKVDLVVILMNEYKDNPDHLNRLKRIIGEPVSRNRASGKA